MQMQKFAVAFACYRFQLRGTQHLRDCLVLTSSPHVFSEGPLNDQHGRGLKKRSVSTRLLKAAFNPRLRHSIVSPLLIPSRHFTQ